MKLNESHITGLLIAAVSVVATAMALLHLTTWLEAASFITGAVCVWLTVKENIWNFPLGLINVATFCVVFYQSRLFADASLQVVYFVLGVIGWFMWLHGGENRSQLKVTRASTWELSMLTALAAAGTIGFWQLFQHLGGSASFWDALTSSISLVAQWLLNRKRLESWVGWILVDAIYVPLYVYKELYLTAVLYAAFLVMAVMGLRAWRASWRQAPAASDVGPLVGAAIS